MSIADEEIVRRFPVGYYELHPNVSLNFQMNRFYGWTNDDTMLDEMRSAGGRIVSYDDWTQEMLALSDSALAAGRRLAAAYYSRGAQFFLDPSDPRYEPALTRFLENVEAGNGVTAEDHFDVPYQGGHLSAYRFTPEQPRGTIVVFGGYDSYIAEWLPAALALRDAGLDTVVFDGPGQGVVLDTGMEMTPDWHLPVGAVLDYFGLSGITLLGFSLGGCLVLRASAREPRVERVIAWDILTSMFEVVTEGFHQSGLDAIADASLQISDAIVNAAVGEAADADLLTAWMVHQGTRVLGSATAADFFRDVRAYRTDDVSAQITQPVLLLAGNEDHYVPYHQLGDQLMSLTGAPSVTSRTFTEQEQAQNHCQIGNQGLALRVILDWLDAVGGRATEPVGT